MVSFSLFLLGLWVSEAERKGYALLTSQNEARVVPELAVADLGGGRSRRRADVLGRVLDLVDETGHLGVSWWEGRGGGKRWKLSGGDEGR